MTVRCSQYRVWRRAACLKDPAKGWINQSGSNLRKFGPFRILPLP